MWWCCWKNDDIKSSQVKSSQVKSSLLKWSLYKSIVRQLKQRNNYRMREMNEKTMTDRHVKDDPCLPLKILKQGVGTYSLNSNQVNEWLISGKWDEVRLKLFTAKKKSLPLNNIYTQDDTATSSQHIHLYRHRLNKVTGFIWTWLGFNRSLAPPSPNQ